MAQTRALMKSARLAVECVFKGFGHINAAKNAFRSSGPLTEDCDLSSANCLLKEANYLAFCVGVASGYSPGQQPNASWKAWLKWLGLA